MATRDDMMLGDLNAGGLAPPVVGSPEGKPKKPKRVVAPAQRLSFDISQRAGSGVMVAFFLPAEVAGELAVAGGEAAADLHVTLAYLGKAAALSEDGIARARAAVAKAATAAAPVTGVIGGIGRFLASETSDGKDVLYAPFDSAALDALRAELVAALDEAGTPPMRSHGFSPHITLAYVEPNGDVVLPAAPERRELTFECVTFAVAGEREEMRLGATPRVTAPHQRLHG